LVVESLNQKTGLGSKVSYSLPAHSCLGQISDWIDGYMAP